MDFSRQSIGNFLQILERTCDHQKIFFKKKTNRPTELEERGEGESMREKGKKLKRLKRIAEYSN